MFPLLPFLLYGGATAGLLWWTSQPSTPVSPNTAPGGVAPGNGAPVGVPGLQGRPGGLRIPAVVREIVPRDVVVISTEGAPGFAYPFLLADVVSIAGETANLQVRGAFAGRPSSASDLASQRLAGLIAVTPFAFSLPIGNILYVQRSGRAAIFIAPPGMRRGGGTTLSDPRASSNDALSALFPR